MTHTHSFNVEIATEIGLHESLILQHIVYWCESNKDNPDFNIDGVVFGYASLRVLSEIFPYFSTKKIRLSLQKLEEKGLIVICNLNKDSNQNAIWFALTAYGEEIAGRMSHYGLTHIRKKENPINEI